MNRIRPQTAGLALWALLTLVALTGGCYLASVHPIANTDQRVVDPDLTGTWANGPDTLRISGDTVDNIKFDVVEGPGPATEVTRRGSLDVMITHINGRNFLDIRPAEILDAPISIQEQMLLIPMHGIIRYSILGDTLRIQHLDFREFNSRNKKGRAYGLELERLSADGPLLITSSTERIRRFLARFGGDERVFEEPTLYIRQP